jgi:hypothetical protein
MLVVWLTPPCRGRSNPAVLLAPDLALAHCTGHRYDYSALSLLRWGQYPLIIAF